MSARIDYVAPTTFAEESYQAKRQPGVTGPAGILIPWPNAAYRTSKDSDLLDEIARAAYQSWSTSQTTRIENDEFAAALLADLRDRFPAEHMAVLAIYGLTVKASFAVIDMDGAPEHSRALKITLPEPIELPASPARFKIAERGSGAPLPQGFDEYVNRRAQARERLSEGNKARYWPAQFHARTKRWPTWAEIATDWPIVGEWMAAQRRGAR